MKNTLWGLIIILLLGSYGFTLHAKERLENKVEHLQEKVDVKLERISDDIIEIKVQQAEFRTELKPLIKILMEKFVNEPNR